MKESHAELIDDVLTEICWHIQEEYFGSPKDIENSNRIYSRAQELKIIDDTWLDRRNRYSDIERYCDLLRTINLINLK
jgi:hypothetical protein